MAITKVENKKEEEKNISSPKTEKTNEGKKVSLDPDEDIEDDEPLQAEFEEESTANSFASQPTKENKSAEEIPDNMSAEEVQRQTLEFENSRSGKLEYKDLKQTAEFIITLMDTALSTAFKLFARDTAASAYSMPAANKKILIEQLALILSKYQAKFKIEFLFFMGLIVLYAPMGIAAFKNRKLTTPKKKVIETTKKEEKILSELITESKVVNLQDQEEKQPAKEGKVFIPKRPKGQQRKVSL